MPTALQIFNIYRSRFIGRYLQDQGVPCVPTVTWGDYKSFRFCFLGISRGSQVAISSMSTVLDKSGPFCLGYREMIDRIEPTKVYWYGLPNTYINDDRIVYFDPFYRRFSHGRKRR